MDQKVEMHLACSINISGMEISERKKTKDGASDGTTGDSALPQHEQYKLMYRKIAFRGRKGGLGKKGLGVLRSARVLHNGRR